MTKEVLCMSGNLDCFIVNSIHSSLRRFMWPPLYFCEALLTAYREVTTLNPSANSTRMEFIRPRAITLQSCPFRSGNLDFQNHTCVHVTWSSRSLAFCIPDR